MAPSESATPIPLSANFCADDADVVIRAAGALEFRAHKLILSLSSPIFKDMFTLPQQPSDTPGILPHVDVQDPPKAWENILQTIYPTLPNPTIDNLDDLESLLFAAQAYEMQFVIETHKKVLEHREFIKQDPLRLYAIACACGFEDQATHIANKAELVAVTRRPDSGDLKGLTFGAYRRLVSFLVDRDIEWRQTLDRAKIPECDDEFPCGATPGELQILYGEIKKDVRGAYLQTEEVYLKALEARSRHTSGCISEDCPSSIISIKAFILERINEREKVCDVYRPKKWYCGATIALHPNPLINILLIRFT